MKPTEGAPHCDFAGDESTSVMGGDLLSSLTERSRRIDVLAPLIPEPEISIEIDEPEPVTTMSPAAQPLPPPPIPDGEFPAIGDEESTVMMEEPEPTTVARRVVPQPVPAPAHAPDPQWTADLAPRALATIRVAPLPAPEPETIAAEAPAPAVGSRLLSLCAALALGVAAWTVGLGHHDTTAAISSPAPSVSSAVVGPLVLRHRI